MPPKQIRNLIPKIRKQLPIALDIIEKEHIEKITRRPTNIKELLDELRVNIESKNHWATFYLIQVFSERIADFIIVKEKDFFKTKEIPNNSEKGYFTLKEKIKDNFCFGDKIRCLKELSNSNCHTTKDFETFIDILELLRFIRNKYMFHVTNYDEYSFIYKKEKMYKKEEFFIKKFSKLVERIKILMKDFHKNSYEWHLLERYSSSLERNIESYKRSIKACRKKDGRRTIDSTGVYEEIPSLLSRISFVFILFFGRKNLTFLS